LYHLPSDIDRELLKVVTNQQWDERGPLLEKGAQYTATIHPGDYTDNQNIGMMPLHFACRDGAPTKVIKEIYRGYPAALVSSTSHGSFTPLDLLNDVIDSEGSAGLKRRGYTMARAVNVRAFLEAEMDQFRQPPASCP